MRKFALILNGTTYYCDMDGRVSDTANVIGTWRTTDDNNIRIKPDSGAIIDVAVGWSFNGSNQLVVSQNGTTIFTIHNSAEDLPRYWLDKNILHIDPDGDGDFDFPLKCQWGLDPSGNLRVTINGTTSTLDGYIEDARSRFRFQFYDKELPNFPSSLVFSGEWERIKLDGADTNIRLHFVLEDPKLEELAAPLNLPKELNIDPTRNHLALVYKSKSYGERRLEFLGSIEIKPNWTLTFKIADSKDATSGVKSTKVTVETTFEWDAAQGTVSLFVGKKKQHDSQQIDIGGSLQAKFKSGALDWSFAYRNSTAGGRSSLVFASAMTFTFKNGQIWVQYIQGGNTWQLDVTAKLVKKNFTLGGKVTIKNDPEGRTLGGFLTVNF